MKALRWVRNGLVIGLVCAATGASAEVMLQWFETEWEEMYRRMPEVAAIGYDYIWTPPPTKAPTGLGTKWGNVGYSLYDRFDVGQIPQRGSWDTRYGSIGDLHQMVGGAHACDVKIIPDIIMNHNGNGPDFRDYPQMVPEDFHVQWNEGYVNDLNYMRGPRMDQWSPDNGYGGTLWQELVNLVDIRTEDLPRNSSELRNRFTGGNNTPGWNFVAGTSFLRHVGQYDMYPYFPNGYTNETAAQMLWRWIAWLGDTVDYDGLRLDAGKHVEYEFFGWKGDGFLHEAQWSYNARRGYSDSSADEADELFKNYLIRNDALIFAEILSYQSELNYWYGDMSQGVAGNSRNPMRFLDYPLKQRLYSAFSDGNLSSLTAGGGGIAPDLGIMYAWGHDEAGPNKVQLAYAYILTHIGFPMVYFTGNNITWADNGTKTWMRPGYDSHALADQSDRVANLVWIHQQFARGNEYDRWTENDFFAYERYDDINLNGSPDAGEGLLLVALNDSGWDQTRTVACSFQNGTVLKDYTGLNPNPVTVSSGQAAITVPGNSGSGYVCYAPANAELDILVKDNGAAAGTIPWVVPGGIHAPSKTQQITRVTSTNLTLQANVTPASGTTVDSVLMKWGRGTARVATNDWYTAQTNNTLVAGNFQKCVAVNGTNYFIDVTITETNIPEGLNVVKMRAFNQRAAGLPALFNTDTEMIYVDRRGPENSFWPPDGSTLVGDAILTITNRDLTAYGMTVSVDGASDTAHELYKGLWKFNLQGLSAGGHTVTVTTTEADWGATRSVINTSIYTLVYQVQANPQTIALGRSEGDEIQIPFFTTGVQAPGSPSQVRLYWNGYELPFNAGTYSNVFNGEVIFRDFLGNVTTDRLWGAFVNGQQFFEAVRVDGVTTSRATRRVAFNLYGINAIDSDGDALPDNLEMPFIDTEGAPGADAPWPGDSNKNFIPEWGENWTRLNPYNHSTFYSGQWDDQNDFDGDGFSNGEEVMAGYGEANIYKYNIYDANSKPSGSPTNTSSVAFWSPNPAVRAQVLNITYSPADGPLKGVNPVYIHIGHSARTLGYWTQVMDVAMTPSGTNWTYAYTVSNDATSVDFVFHDGGANWDNNNGSDWQSQVQGQTNFTTFAMDGEFDGGDSGSAYTVFPEAMKILAAANGEDLYLATWSTEANDVFLYCADDLGDAVAAPWAKAGYIFYDKTQMPYLTADSDTKFAALNNVSGSITNGSRSPSSKNALEAVFNMVDAFGHVPEAVYIASVAYGPSDGGGVQSQGPYAWDAGDNIEIMEFQRVPIASIRDEDMDGYFDMGKPQMWTVVNGNTNDANYGLRRFFLNELAGETAELTVLLKPNVGGTSVVSSVELFSNINRRDFAVLPGDEDPDTVTVDSETTYYRAYPMTDLGGGVYRATITIDKCGAYRVNARYKVNGGDFVYYTDNGLRRDCAVVVSPKKALDSTMYELNPMIAEAVDTTFFGRSTFEDIHTVNTNRPDVMNTNYFTELGVNMLWLQPIHPIGSEGRQIDPITGLEYDPGSPYAVRNYWKVNSVLGDPASSDEAMSEFTNFVQGLDRAGVGVMLDGTFNHSAWDAEIGEMGVTMGITTSATDLIRVVRPQWYSKTGDYGTHATHWGGDGSSDLAVAPDRIDFGKWTDVADFYFGTYDCLVQEPPADTNWAWSSKWYSRYLFEEDRFDGFTTNATRELWQYFAEYPLYWLERTGHPDGTPKNQSHKGIDGLRCDFAQGLPSLFWEYTINRTRSVKWDFLFMAESLDGYREVGGSKRHGVGFRSSRHFDILNENMVFFWRDTYFDYLDYNGGATPETYYVWQSYDNRRNAYDVSPILNNLTSHDEILPSDVQWRLVYVNAIQSAVDGVPMILYGQEAGMQNDWNNYHTNHPGIDPANNVALYEINFSKAIPNFKRYNHMTNVWNNINGGWADGLLNTYRRIGQARERFPALRSQSIYYLSRTSDTNWDPNIFGVAKMEEPGVSAATQDVVFVFVNNDFESSTNRWQTYLLNATTAGGQNWFGIESGRSYNLVDLISGSTNYVWGSNRTGADLIANGITVGLTGNPYLGEQAQYLKLVDVAGGWNTNGGSSYSNWDRDGDGMNNDFEIANGLNPDSAVGVNGGNGDLDNDGVSNYDEMLSGTNPNDIDDVLEVYIEPGSGGMEVIWPSKTDINYQVQVTEDLLQGEQGWAPLGSLRTALTSTQVVVDASTDDKTNRYYRINVKP